MKHTMTPVLLLMFLVFFGHTAFAQTEKPKLYDPQQDVKADLKKSLALAEKDGKHVLLMIGGNW